MKQKQYQEPTTKVVKLQHTGMLMVSDGRSVGLRNYEMHDEGEE
jgi:hypothetical protein